MSNKNDTTEDQKPKPSGHDSEVDGGDQGIQINENTIEDPDPPEPVPGDDHLHSRRDVEKQEQGIQINENTINEKLDEDGSDEDS